MRWSPREQDRIHVTTSALISATLAVLASMVVGVHGVADDLLENVPVPEFLPGVVNLTEREGDVARLPCSVRNLGTKEVVWRRIEEDRFLTIGKMTWTSDPNISMDPSRKPGQITNWDLVIRHLKPKDAGVYECQITSKAGLVRFVTLNVVGPPITKPDASQLHRERPKGPAPNLTVSVCGAADMHGCLISITGKRYVNLGERIHLVCNASGGVRIPDEIDWFKAGDKIDSVKYRNIVIEKYQSMAHRSFISELIIDHSSLHDTGDYICRSSRNDIANLKVTVLHAGRDNYRRGTAEAGSQGGGTDPAGLSSYKCRILLLEICLAAMLTLNFSFFGLYS